MAILINAPGKNFLEAKVRLGDRIKITKVFFVNAAPDKHLFIDGSAKALIFTDLIVEEVAKESLKVEAYNEGNSLNLVDANLNLVDTGDYFEFDVIRNLSKDEQVDLLVEKIKSFDSERVVFVWPPEAEMEDKTTITGSSIAAMVASVVASYPAQQSFTNLRFNGPYKLKYSNDYFNTTQLNRLSAAGAFVLVQDAPGGQVYCRHQKTTSQSGLIQKTEFSVVKAIDKYSTDLYDLAKVYIGKYNISQDLLTELDDVISQYNYNAKSHKSPYCGSLIINNGPVTLRANLEGSNTDILPGTIKISVNVEIGYPANNIDIDVLAS